MTQMEGKDAEQNVSPHAWSTTFDVAICRNWTSSGGVAWPFRSLPQHSTSPDGRRPQEKALPAWTCTNFPAGGFVQPVSWSSPLRGVQGRSRVDGVWRLSQMASSSSPPPARHRREA